MNKGNTPDGSKKQWQKNEKEHSFIKPFIYAWCIISVLALLVYCFLHKESSFSEIFLVVANFVLCIIVAGFAPLFGAYTNKVGHNRTHRHSEHRERSA